jgi:hypothetical protein
MISLHVIESFLEACAVLATPVIVNMGEAS